MTLAPSREALDAHLRGLLPRDHAARLLAHARPSLALSLHPTTAPLDAGASKVGGDPDLPDEVRWPTDPSGVPLSFVAQVDLSRLPAVDDDLPREGVLSFFYDTVRQPWGSAAAHTDSARVLHLTSGALRARPQPTLDGRRACDEFERCALRAEPEWTLPMDPAAWPPEPFTERYLDAWGDRTARSRMLGHPDVQQEAMEGACDAIRRRRPPAEFSARLGLDAPARGAWVLLLQLASERDAALSFGSGSGQLYIWIHRDDLRARDFSRAQALVQDT